MFKTISTREEWKEKLAEIREFEACVKADIGKAITALAPDAEISSETIITYGPMANMHLSAIIDDVGFLDQIAWSAYRWTCVWFTAKFGPDAALKFAVHMDLGVHRVEIVGGDFIVRERHLSEMTDIHDFIRATVPKLLPVLTPEIPFDDTMSKLNAVMKSINEGLCPTELAKPTPPDPWKAALAEARRLESECAEKYGRLISTLAPTAEVTTWAEVVDEGLSRYRLSDNTDIGRFASEMSGRKFLLTDIWIRVKFKECMDATFRIVNTASGSIVIGSRFSVKCLCLDCDDRDFPSDTAMLDFIRKRIPEFAAKARAEEEPPKAAEPDVRTMAPSAEPEQHVTAATPPYTRLGLIAMAVRFACNVIRHRDDPFVDTEMLGTLASIRCGRDRRYLHAVMRRLGADCAADLARRLSATDDFDAAYAATYGAAREGFGKLIAHVDRNGMTRPLHR